MKASIGVFKVERVGYVGCAQTFSKEERIAMEPGAAGRRISIRFSRCLGSSESFSLVLQ